MRRNQLAKAHTRYPRGLQERQWIDLQSYLQKCCFSVCSASEEIPFLDFLDLIYMPKAKAHWLANHSFFGADWALTDSYNSMPSAQHYVTPGPSLKPILLKSYAGGNQGANKYKINLPHFAGGLSRDLEFAPLDMFAASGLPEHVRPLHEKYGRHIVRCAREAQVFNMAMERVAALFKCAPCTRTIAHFFPEIIPHVPRVPNGEFVYWQKTKNNSFTSKYKEDKYTLENMAATLGPNWEAYKRFIIGLIVRAGLVESVRRERKPLDAVYYDVEKHWYKTEADGGKPPQEWLVKLSYSPLISTW